MPCKTKESQKVSARKHYLGNVERMKKRAYSFTIQARKRNKDFLKEYLSEHPCVDCGEDDVIVLEFDHVKDEKVLEVTRGANRGWSLNKIKEEINKCEIRCANCHRRATHKRKNIL